MAAPEEGEKVSQSLGEPLFELPLSGWYWQVTPLDPGKTDKRASRSLWDRNLPKLEEHGTDLTAAGIRLGYVDGPEGQNLRIVERPVDLGADGKFLVSVAGDATEPPPKPAVVGATIMVVAMVSKPGVRAAYTFPMPGVSWQTAALVAST